MFNVTWLPINTNTLTADLGPGQCGIDIVGNSSFPALFSALDNNFIYFRMRLNCDPRMQNKNELENKVWGILIKNAFNGNPQFTARVNAKNDNAIQVFTADSNDPFITLQCQQAIDLSSSGNVEVDPANSNFDSTEDFFLDFKVPLSCFPNGFFNENHIFCGFTSDDDQNINKEVPPPYIHGNQNNPALCGGSTPPPQPKVKITKTVTPTNTTTCTPPQDFTVTITVTNISDFALNNIFITDIITSQFVPLQPPKIFGPFNLAAGASHTETFIVNGSFPNAGSFSFNTVTVTQGSTVIGTFEGPTITVLPCPTRGVKLF